MFKYCFNPDSNEPIMLLNKQIGMTTLEGGEWDGEPYIDGAEFQEELMLLDTMSKKCINVWIVSPGGNVIQALNIFSAILKSNTPVDTFNMGIAASSAAMIMMAGRKRRSLKHSMFMIHQVSGADDDKMKAAFMDSMSKAVSPRSNLSETTIRFMMDCETWINADDCYKHGIYTEQPEEIDSSNTKYYPATMSTDVKALMSFSNSILNQKIHTSPMKKVTNRLNIAENSTEDAIDAAVEALQNAKNQADSDLASLQEQLTSANKALEDAQNNVTEIQKQLTEATQGRETAENQLAETKATEMVNSFKNRIGDKPEVLKKWVNRAIDDFEGTKDLLSELPINAKAPGLPEGSNSGGKNRPRKNVTEIMNTINQRTNPSSK